MQQLFYPLPPPFRPGPHDIFHNPDIICGLGFGG
uniref:Uncharacterized protein n=1 Tax=Anguilla anguilla TaxID=7936 RepID=A0A0E9QW16_ANGAN